MAYFKEIILAFILSKVQSEDTVIRVNYGLLYRNIGKMQVVTDKWLHIFRIQLPDIPDRPTLATMTCKKQVGSRNPSGEFRYAACVTQHKAGTTPANECDSTHNLSESTCLAATAYSSLVKDIYTELSMEYEHLVELVTDLFKDSSNRHKRALLDLSGIFSTVFGFGRQKDIDQVKHAVDEVHNNLKNQALKEAQMFKDMHSAIDVTNKRLEHVSQRLFQVANYTRRATQQLGSIMLHGLGMLALRLQHVMELSLEASKLIREISEFRQRLLELLQGKLSPQLIRPNLVRAMLADIANRLRLSQPEFTIALDSPSEAYSLENFYIQRHDKSIYLGIYVPLAYENAAFDLYQIDSYPLPAASSTDHVTYIRNPRAFLAQSRDQKYYFHPSKEDLYVHCTTRHNRHCEYQPSLRNGNQDFTCEYAVFTVNISQLRLASTVCLKQALNQRL